MTQKQIEKVIKDVLKAFSPKSAVIDNDSIPDNLIDTSKDRRGVATKTLFRHFVRVNLLMNDHEKDTPIKREWLSLPVSEIAQKLLVILVILITSFTSQAQLEINLGAGKTDAKNAAVSIGLTYARSFDSIWNNSDYFFAGKHSFFAITPDIEIHTGTEDAFSAINLKVTGLWTTFKTKTEDDLILADLSRTFHAFPMSLGVETNSFFNNINGIAEIGWVPWYQTSTNPLPEIIKNTHIGFWLQGGYKFKVDSLRQVLTGGKEDESLELPNTAILRLKGSAGFDTKTIIQVNSLNVGLVGNADAWYDAANGAFYHKIDIRGRFYLTQDGWIDFVWQKGAGAPTFNTGEQYGIGATIRF